MTEFVRRKATARWKCDRCGRRYRGAGDWNLVFCLGVAVGALCPSCQTPQESAEAAVNEAVLTYTVDPLGLVRGAPKNGAR